MKFLPSSEDNNNPSASPKIPLILWTLGVDDPFQRNPPLFTVLSQMNPVHPPSFILITTDIF
jgi:hypothetical protein